LTVDHTLIAQAAIAAAVAWGSGLRLYLVLFILGLLGRFAGFELPDALGWLSHPLSLGVTGFLSLTEFFADKIPWLDSVWDALHSFLRIPAGAALAASLFPDLGGGGMTALVALLGGGVAASAQLTKTGSRAVINASPEPFTNVAASVTEEAMLGAGLWTAFNHPVVFLVLLGIFLIAAIALTAFFVRAIRRLFAERKSVA
jgi:Domain of unknown function (DUF4126)